jgi:hypothetical protein
VKQSTRFACCNVTSKSTTCFNCSEQLCDQMEYPTESADSFYWWQDGIISAADHRAFRGKFLIKNGLALYRAVVIKLHKTIILPIISRDGTAQSVQRLSTGWTVAQSELEPSPLHVVQAGTGAHSSSYPMGLSSGGKATGT